jgi:hypothetical protein
MVAGFGLLWLARPGTIPTRYKFWSAGRSQTSDHLLSAGHDSESAKFLRTASFQALMLE